MSLETLPKMLWSYQEGWEDLVRTHPSVTRLFAMYVVPMSLIPAAMIVYASVVHHDLMTPQITAREALIVAIVFFLAELAMVPLMASIIQQMGELIDIKPAYQDAFTLAAVAPTPLWLSALAVFIPSMAFNVAVLAVAWVASAALIYHGAPPLFGLTASGKSRLMASFVLGAGVMAWIGLMVVLVMVLSMIIGYR